MVTRPLEPPTTVLESPARLSGIAGTTYALAPFWDDQTAFAADGHGAFTTTTGSAPNRIFYIEWRTFYFGEPDQLNYEVAFFEDGSLPFQYIYNTITPSTYEILSPSW